MYISYFLSYLSVNEHKNIRSAIHLSNRSRREARVLLCPFHTGPRPIPEGSVKRGYLTTNTVSPLLSLPHSAQCGWLR
jgi:hypothetical protein